MSDDEDKDVPEVQENGGDEDEEVTDLSAR